MTRADTKIQVKALLLAAVMLNTSCATVDTSTKDDTYAVIWAFDDISKERFGVSLSALILLAQWTPHSYMPLDYLEHSGKIKLLRDLERENLIVGHEVQGLPNGTQSQTAHVKFDPVGRGLEIVATFQLLRDESAP